MKKTLKRILPSPLTSVIKKVYYFFGDRYELLSGKRDSLTPPKRLIYIGSGDFKETGLVYLEFFKTMANLKPHEQVLDVGCGIGRMAFPLTGYLSKEGSYEGLDIVRKGIRWCQKKITPHFSNFRFQVADIKNLRYNPSGKYEGSTYRFPYADNRFDFVFLTSVFTHLLPDDMENYLAEIARVMRPGGRCFITFFLLNAESNQMISQGKGDFTFRHRYNNHAIQNQKIPEHAVAFNEDYALNLFQKDHLEIQGNVHYGSWCGRENFFDYQDVIIAKKTG